MQAVGASTHTHAGGTGNRIEGRHSRLDEVDHERKDESNQTFVAAEDAAHGARFGEQAVWVEGRVGEKPRFSEARGLFDGAGAHRLGPLRLLLVNRLPHSERVVEDLLEACKRTQQNTT